MWQPLDLRDPRLSRLNQIPDPPRRLYLRGDPRSLELPSIAIVGTRRPSAYGIRAAMVMARALAELGLAVVSGLARGIDGSAHQGALAAKGATIAVLGHGLDRVYPPEHARLAEQIVTSGGCLLSEYPDGEPPRKAHFPERNRLIAGLTLGTLVIEAAEKSGSLITARCALEYNREVFVIAGPFDDDAHEGSHRLLQQGAKLVTSALDIVEEIAPMCRSEKSVEKVEQKKCAAAREVFLRHAGVLTLEQCREAKLDDLDALVARRSVAEIAPQQFAWIED